MIDRKLTYGVLFVALIIGLVAATVLTYRGALRDSVPMTVEADRAGLTLASGTPVKMRGVEIGRVGQIDPVDDGASIELEIDPGKYDLVPSDVTAQIVPPTAFGAKYIQLSPGDEDSQSIHPGATIRADDVTVEVDTAFENLTEVLDVARPAEVNAALTAVATSVDQRGESIGELITSADAYLESFNPVLPDLSEDIRLADDVADVYETARPDLVALAKDAGVTSTTLVDQQDSLRALEVSLTSFSRETRTLLDSSGDRLTRTMKLLDPVTQVLAKYSPELPCTVEGLAAANELAEAAVGGTNPGVTTITRLVPARDPYTYDENLPEVGDDRGPGCYGLPNVSQEEAEKPPPVFQTGANPYSGPRPTVSEKTLATLLGALAGGANLPGVLAEGVNLP